MILEWTQARGSALGKGSIDNQSYYSYIPDQMKSSGAVRFLLLVCSILVFASCAHSPHRPASLAEMYTVQTIGKGQWQIYSPEGSMMFYTGRGAKWNGFYDSDGHGVYDAVVVGTEVILYAPSWAVLLPMLGLTVGIEKIAPPWVATGAFFLFIPPALAVNLVNAGVVWIYDVIVHDIPLTPIELYLQKRVDRDTPPPDDLDKDKVCDAENPPVWMCGER